MTAERTTESPTSPPLLSIPVADDALLYRLELVTTGANIHGVCNMRQTYLSALHLVRLSMQKGDVESARHHAATVEATTRRIVAYIASLDPTGM